MTLLVTSSNWSPDLVWKRFLIWKLRIRHKTKGSKPSNVSFCQELSLVQVLTSYYMCKLKIQTVRGRVHPFPLQTMKVNRASNTQRSKKHILSQSYFQKRKKGSQTTFYRQVKKYLEKVMLWVYDKNNSKKQSFRGKKGVFRNFTKLTGKHQCQNLFLIKMQAWGLRLYLKRDSGTGVFLWILWNF